jgi:carbon monoxide dehydrogenase subunit G
MELRNEHQIAARQADVWEALNSPEVLKASIPGCETIEQLDGATMRAKVRSKVGPMSVTFTGVVTLSEVDAPNGYTLAFQGEGGAAGFVRGSARVELFPQGESTLLRYASRAQIGGKLGQIGSRLINSVAARTAAQFFDNFSEIVTGSAASVGPGQDLSGAGCGAPEVREKPQCGPGGNAI